MYRLFQPKRRVLAHVFRASCALAACMASGCAASKQFGVPVERYRSHIALLASDELKGRGTGSEGVDLAGGYIAGQFSAAGLLPGAGNGTYFQSFTVPRKGKLLDDTFLSLGAADAALKIDEDYTPFSFSGKGAFEGDVVFVGYGITNPQFEYDDYAGLDVTGRVVLMFRREPPGWNESPRNSRHALFSTKVALAKKHGAAAVMIVNREREGDDEDTLMRFRTRGGDHGLPAVHLKRRVAAELLVRAGMKTLAELQNALDSDGENRSAPLSGVHAAGRVSFEQNDLTVRNIIGILPGDGANAEEFVVVGGHYDHLGVRRGKIHNGADDNASGTAGVIETAFAMSAKKHRDRSLVFMAFGGEEIGLLGSRHFVEHPTVPLKSISAMINMDMIGRVDHDSEANMLGIQGLGTGSTFEALVKSHAGRAGIAYLPDPSSRGPSDHSSFNSAGIPSLFFFTGIHDDYHSPGDDTDKINFAGAVQVTGLVCDIALDLVNTASPPAFIEVTRQARIFRGDRPRQSRVVMGIIPESDDESGKPGWLIQAVRPDGAAGKAGMLRGDRITSVAGSAVAGQSDYRKAIAGKKPGDVVAVVVLRDGRNINMDVTLQGR